MDKKRKSDDTLRGVRCEVENCVYHTHDDCCTADTIEVVFCNTDSDNETDCGTFTDKSDA